MLNKLDAMVKRSAEKVFVEMASTEVPTNV
jgi:hypothetical protein